MMPQGPKATDDATQDPCIAIIGAGPAGLMAADHLSRAGQPVRIFDHRPAPGQKFLMAGLGGLNITNSEDLDSLIHRYGAAAPWLAPALRAFTPDDLRAFCAALGTETFVGSSGRVFPVGMKAAPLLRAWIRRLQDQGVQFHLRTRWTGWDAAGALTFVPVSTATMPNNVAPSSLHPRASLLALGGASWPRLGSDGAWTALLAARGVAITPLRPANCGFIVPWAPVFGDKYAGTPLKPVILTHAGMTRQGEITITRQGLEGSLIYAFSRALREAIAQDGQTTIMLNLRPGLDHDRLSDALSGRQGALSWTHFLRKAGGLSPAAAALVAGHLRHPQSAGRPSPSDLASLIQALPITLQTTAPLDRAISSAGGIAHSALDSRFMLHAIKGVFVAGEMLDWEAPTGGYLLQACFSTGLAAAQGLLDWVSGQTDPAVVC